MNKGVKRVRRSINQRKKERGITSIRQSGKKIAPPPFPEEEEKHGYFPVFTDDRFSVKGLNRRVTGIAVKGILSIMLFFAAALLFQTDTEFLSGPKTWAANTLTEEFPFARVNQWYQETFGAPMAVSSGSEDNGQALAFPVNGAVSETFQSNGKGIMLAPDEETNVSALQEGVVTFAGKTSDTGKTVIVQHPDNSETVYGNLSSIDVHLYQFIDNSQKLGLFTPNDENQSVYFAIEQNNDYVDPVQVIQVDDNR
ncbi:M23 family metallopeptidase [Lentibacillus amyloliquefaciens]|uniref:Stage IV sporulation protein FA n=1 Tax=Lentibacillus amyloliquefaciens TaxID=1472767 RepID=A0A0U3NN74_9BACI|nr:M23 family metallopeptidase [Lentibacillus amyloliquefaciens]ALX48203.1 stage IV sporulation protein FA [Lentibacillus amyloliquefaciens]